MYVRAGKGLQHLTACSHIPIANNIRCYGKWGKWQKCCPYGGRQAGRRSHAVIPASVTAAAMASESANKGGPPCRRSDRRLRVLELGAGNSGGSARGPAYVCVCACVYVCVRGRSLAALTVSAPSLPRPAQCTRPRSARCAGSRGAGSSSATCRTAPGSRRGSRPAWRDSGSPPGKAPRAAGTPTRTPSLPPPWAAAPRRAEGAPEPLHPLFPGGTKHHVTPSDRRRHHHLLVTALKDLEICPWRRARPYCPSPPVPHTSPRPSPAPHKAPIAVPGGSALSLSPGVRCGRGRSSSRAPTFSTPTASSRPSSSTTGTPPAVSPPTRWSSRASCGCARPPGSPVGPPRPTTTCTRSALFSTARRPCGRWPPASTKARVRAAVGSCPRAVPGPPEPSMNCWVPKPSVTAPRPWALPCMSWAWCGWRGTTSPCQGCSRVAAAWWKSCTWETSIRTGWSGCTTAQRATSVRCRVSW